MNEVKTRFQSLLFKCNLYRYSTGTNLQCLQRATGLVWPDDLGGAVQVANSVSPSHSYNPRVFKKVFKKFFKKILKKMKFSLPIA